MPGRTRSDLWTPADLARIAGVTDRTIRDWREAGMPTRIVSGQPRFAPEDVWRWREQWHAERAKEAKPKAGGGALLDRKTEAEVALLELRLARETGEVVPVADYERALGRVLDRLTARLRALPVQLAHLGTDAELAAEAEVERVVQELHGMEDDVLEEAPPPLEQAA